VTVEPDSASGEPADLPALPRNRPSARVVVVDQLGAVLLFRIVDPLDDKPPIWITPGGGIDGEESLPVAASRELNEETGLVVSPETLGTPVAVCRGEWTFRGQRLYSEDWYFGHVTTRFDPTDVHYTPLERLVHHSWRWWTPEEVDLADEIILPTGLAGVARAVALGTAPPRPVVLPWTEV
jgi:8-oxo-dGTP pyrophosphatase MutT (NUDIX family)